MREMLFRGKAEIGGNWVYGDLIHRLGGATIGAVDSNGLHELYVSEETVGQYTGLQDKNGTKIFEGDIIKTDSPAYSKALSLGSITYEDGGFCRNNGIDEEGLPLNDFEWGIAPYSLNKEWEIIGNIYDNPELLEV